MSIRVRCAALVTLLSAIIAARDTSAADDPLQPWREGVVVRPVAPELERHVIHAYFNANPESPDGAFTLYYTSETRSGELGDLRIRDRATGRETILASGIVTEDAHRAACQQWSDGGKSVVWHELRDDHWRVMAVDVVTRRERVLALDRQVGFGAPKGAWVPLYGKHWNPGEHRDLELVHVGTGEIRRAVTIAETNENYGDWIERRFGTREVSIFFPVLSPAGDRVFFKLSKPSGGDDFRSKTASERDGKVVYDLKEKRFLRLFEKWGHPSWSPDGGSIFEIGNVAFDVETGKATRHAPSCFSDHPSISPAGDLFVTDADVTKRMLGKPGDWAVAVGSLTRDEFVTLHVFGNARGATSWRHNHPHPAFSADGRRVYFNVNEGPWTTLMVAERGDAAKK